MVRQALAKLGCVIDSTTVCLKGTSRSDVCVLLNVTLTNASMPNHRYLEAYLVHLSYRRGIPGANGKQGCWGTRQCHENE